MVNFMFYVVIIFLLFGFRFGLALIFSVTSLVMISIYLGMVMIPDYNVSDTMNFVRFVNYFVYVMLFICSGTLNLAT